MWPGSTLRARPSLWVRGSLTSPLIRNESVCFWLNILPTADKTGRNCPLQISGSLGNYCGSCPVTSLPPGDLVPTPEAWGLAARLYENPACGKRCWQYSLPFLFPHPSRLRGPSPQISSP